VTPIASAITKPARNSMAADQYIPLSMGIAQNKFQLTD
jgi:hypothetical protein